MDDISRELEKEIAQAKPKPNKQSRNTKVLIVDDFGKIKSGKHLKITIKILLAASIVCFVAAFSFYYLYMSLSRNINSIEDRLVFAEKKVEDLKKTKEELMAKLVILKNYLETEKQTTIMDKQIIGSNNGWETSLNEMTEKTISKSPEIMTGTNEFSAIRKKVSIEQFTIKFGKNKKNLQVQFVVKKISKEPNEIAGKVFIVLKPGGNLENKWIVAPNEVLNNDGIPARYQRGQSFSINNFKQFEFKIKNTASPDSFKEVEFFIFNNQGDLIFRNQINI